MVDFGGAVLKDVVADRAVGLGWLGFVWGWGVETKKRKKKKRS